MHNNIFDQLKQHGYSWNDLYDIVFLFEQKLAEYTGAPYAISVDCCTHGLELCFRYAQYVNNAPESVSIPKHTYLSVPMMLHKVNMPYTFNNTEWNKEYNIHNTNIWDSARTLQPGMFRNTQYQCLSFGVGKPLQIGRGGAILTDDRHAYTWLSRARSDGRDLTVKPWSAQVFDFVGYHYNMTIEQAAVGILMLDAYAPDDHYPDSTLLYPDLSQCPINSK